MDEIAYMCLNELLVRGNMLRKEELGRLDDSKALSDRFVVKARLNLNELLKRRKQEKQVDKKANLIILSSATAVAVVVFLILNL